MASIIKELLGTAATLLSTELNSLANNSSVISSVINSNGVFDNTAGTGSSSTTGDGYERGYLTLHLAALAGSPAGNTSIDIYLIKSLDGGTTYEDGSSSILPTARPDVQFSLDASRATAQTLTRLVFLPACKFKILARNNGTAQTLASSANTVILVPATDEVV